MPARTSATAPGPWRAAAALAALAALGVAAGCERLPSFEPPSPARPGTAPAPKPPPAPPSPAGGATGLPPPPIAAPPGLLQTPHRGRDGERVVSLLRRDDGWYAQLREPSETADRVVTVRPVGPEALGEPVVRFAEGPRVHLLRSDGDGFWALRIDSESGYEVLHWTPGGTVSTRVPLDDPSPMSDLGLAAAGVYVLDLVEEPLSPGPVPTAEEPSPRPLAVQWARFGGAIRGRRELFRPSAEQGGTVENRFVVAGPDRAVTGLLVRDDASSLTLQLALFDGRGRPGARIAVPDPAGHVRVTGRTPAGEDVLLLRGAGRRGEVLLVPSSRAGTLQRHAIEVAEQASLQTCGDRLWLLELTTRGSTLELSRRVVRADGVGQRHALHEVAIAEPEAATPLVVGCTDEEMAFAVPVPLAAGSPETALLWRVAPLP